VQRPDREVSEEELLGRVVAIERGTRRLNPRLTFGQRLASHLLRRSETATGALVRMGLLGDKRLGPGRL
jgi:hypothetical protein